MSEELSLSLEEHKDFVDNSNDLMQSVTPDGRFRYVNHAWRQVLGYGKREVAGMTIRDIIHPDELEHCQALFMRVMSGEDVGLVTTTFVTRDGRKIFVEGNINCHFTDGKPVYTRAIFRDVTRRRQAEEEIGKFKTISDNAGYGAAIASFEGEFLYLNEAYARMHGYTIDELMGKHYSILYTEKSLQDLERFRQKLLQKESFFAEELWRRRKDNTIFPSLTTAGVIKDDQGNPLYTAATASDITERKRAEEELKRNRDYLEKLNNSLEEVIFNITFPDRTIEYVNQAVETVFGYRPDECIGRNTEFLHKSKQAYIEVGKHFSSALEDNKSVFELEFQARKKDGKVIDVDTNFTLIKEHGELTGVISVFRDITKHKQTEDALRESEERYRAILELSGEVGEAVVMLQDTDDKKAVHTFATEEWSHITGYSMEELLGMSWFELLHPDYHEEALERYQRRLGGEVIPTF